MSGMNRVERRSFLQRVQLVFQNPFDSLNPFRTIKDTLCDGYTHKRMHGRPDRGNARAAGAGRPAQVDARALPARVQRPGDNIVLGDSEFPRALSSAVLLEREGVTTRMVPYRDGALHKSDLVEAIDERTRLLVVSSVSFKTGQRLDVARIAEASHRQSALVFVDAVRAVDAVRVAPEGADFVSAATFKWMPGVHGLATLYVSPRTASLIRPPTLAIGAPPSCSRSICAGSSCTPMRAASRSGCRTCSVERTRERSSAHPRDRHRRDRAPQPQPRRPFAAGLRTPDATCSARTTRPGEDRSWPSSPSTTTRSRTTSGAAA